MYLFQVIPLRIFVIDWCSVIWFLLVYGIDWFLKMFFIFLVVKETFLVNIHVTDVVFFLALKHLVFSKFQFYI